MNWHRLVVDIRISIDFKVSRLIIVAKNAVSALVGIFALNLVDHFFDLGIEA